MKKWIAFILVLTCVLGLLGCTKKEPPAVIYDAVRCPDCGIIRNEDEETCIHCEIKKELIEQIIAEKQKEVVSTPQNR